MTQIRRKVQLPDGKICIEVETLYMSNSKTQTRYAYFEVVNNPNDELCLGERIDTSVFNKNYWGKIRCLKTVKVTNQDP